MMIHHNITLDLVEPVQQPRILVKQGDTLTHSLRITLTEAGVPWLPPADAAPVLRWFALDPGSGESARGIYDTLPDGVHAWVLAENQLDFVIAPQLLALPGIVQGDIAFIQGEKTLATFNFEFYVNPVPTSGVEPEILPYYRVATLEQINAALEEIRQAQAGMDQLLAHLEHEVDNLKRIVNDL